MKFLGFINSLNYMGIYQNSCDFKKFLYLHKRLNYKRKKRLKKRGFA